VTEPRPGYLLSPRATILALSGVLLGMLLAALNQTIVATALPSITEDLGGLEHYSWVFSAYMLASTVTSRSTAGSRTSTAAASSSRSASWSSWPARSSAARRPR
jgi:MFS family permease